MPQKYHIKNFDFLLLLLLLTVTIIGILAIGSAKESVQTRQIGGAILGIFLMAVIACVDYHLILKLQWLIYAGNLGLLLLVQLVGDSSHNAQRWLEIAGIRFQPSETAKILLILFYAQFIIKHKDNLNTFSTLAKMILLLLPPLALIYKQPDMSTSIMVAVIFCVILYVGGLSYKIILGLLAVAIPVGVIFLFIVLQPDQTLIEDYQQERIYAWLNPEKYSLTTAYQQQNSITAIGSGQLWGKGLNNNEVGSVKNGNYISEPQTDFIFAIIGEEMGFVGSCAVILLLMAITARCYLGAMQADDIAGAVICSGVGSIVCFQSFINISVTTGILPNTGIPLPFVSYGLTSLVSMYMGMGFVFNVKLQHGNRRRTSSEKEDDTGFELRQSLSR